MALSSWRPLPMAMSWESLCSKGRQRRQQLGDKQRRRRRRQPQQSRAAQLWAGVGQREGGSCPATHPDAPDAAARHARDAAHLASLPHKLTLQLALAIRALGECGVVAARARGGGHNGDSVKEAAAAA